MVAPLHTVPPPSPFCPNTCASQMRGEHHPCSTINPRLSGLSPPKHKVQRAPQPPPDHESQMNSRIKDPPPYPTASRPGSIGSCALPPHNTLLKFSSDVLRKEKMFLQENGSNVTHWGVYESLEAVPTFVGYSAGLIKVSVLSIGLRKCERDKELVLKGVRRRLFLHVCLSSHL